MSSKCLIETSVYTYCFAFLLQIKLFKEWFIQWNIESKENFLKKLGEIDPSFIEKFNKEIEEKADSQVNHVAS